MSVLQSQKQFDLQVVERMIAKLEERLSFAFLHTAIQRQAERVTAQEIRYMAEQLETAMGGVYSLLSQEFQLPLVAILMKRMESANEIPTLPKKGSVNPTIITGIEALGRGNDLQKLREFVAEIGNLAQINPAVVQSLNPDDLIKRIATGLGIDTDGLIKSQEQLAQEAAAQEEQMQNEQMMNMAEKAVAPVANNLSKQQ